MFLCEHLQTARGSITFTFYIPKLSCYETWTESSREDSEIVLEENQMLNSGVFFFGKMDFLHFYTDSSKRGEETGMH